MKAKIKLDSVINRTKDQVSCDLAGEAVILSLKNSTYFGLNAVGSRIWDLVQKPKKVSKVLDTLLEEYNVEKKDCESDLIKLLGDLEENNLIEIKNEEVN